MAIELIKIKIEPAGIQKTVVIFDPKWKHENDQRSDHTMLIQEAFPADTLFHPGMRKTYDCAICLYHDQGLIPIKTLDFHGGVNITLGLPIVRTSPDHGTAFDIAGQGKANPASLTAALTRAAELASIWAQNKAAA